MSEVFNLNFIQYYGWEEYDDFSCGDPFTPYCKIIDGGIVQ